MKKIVKYTEDYRAAWTEFVERSPNTNIAHSIGWRDVIEKGLGHKPKYVMVVEDSRVRGVMPLFLVKTWWRSRYIISLPWIDYGGVCGDNPEIEKMLLDEAREMAQDEKAEFIEFRSIKAQDPELVYRQDKVTFILDLDEATILGNRHLLASALEKIAASPQKLAHANRATAPMYIVNPLARAGEMAAKATATHPPIAERIKVLRSMAGADFRSYQESFRQATGKKGVIPPSALKDDGGAGLRPGSAGVAGAAGSSGEAGGIREPQASQRTLARQVDDFFYRKGGYKRIPCTCGTVLKIPPDFKSSQATCPRCGKVHDVA